MIMYRTGLAVVQQHSSWFSGCFIGQGGFLPPERASIEAPASFLLKHL